MAEEAFEPPRQLSLVPYTNVQESQAVALRSDGSVVEYDPVSREMRVRALTDGEPRDCPYCGRPLTTDGATSDHADQRGRPGQPLRSDAAYMNPRYFALLAASQQASPVGSAPPTPSRRFFPAALRSGRSRDVSGSGAPSPAERAGPSDGTSTTDSGQTFGSSAFTPGFFRQNFVEKRVLGRGGGGEVLLVEHILSGITIGQFACKRIPVGDSYAYFEKIVLEVRLLQNIPHENLVRYHWSWLENHQSATFGPSVPHLWVLQDFCNGGDLHDYVLGSRMQPTSAEEIKDRFRKRSRGETDSPRFSNSFSNLTFEEILSFFRDITTGLHHLHSKGYVHRDMKPSNCLLHNADGRMKALLSDFGEVQRSDAARKATGATGTISYCAPEVLGRGPDGTFGNFTAKSDIFSLGMVVYFMCFGRLPYLNADDADDGYDDYDKLRAEIIDWPGYKEDVQARPDLPQVLYTYLKRLLSVDPNQRPSTGEILELINRGAPLTETERLAEDLNIPRVSSMDSSPHSTRSREKNRQLPTLSRILTRRSTEVTRSISPVKSRSARPDVSDMDLDLTTPRPFTTTERPTSPIKSPQLMLGPPPAPAYMRRVLTLYHSTYFNSVLRISLFLIKVLLVTLPCRPFASNPWFFYPVMCLAALELGPVSFTMRQSVLLLFVYGLIFLVAQRTGHLCELNRLALWEVH